MTNPATGDVVGSVPSATDADCLAAIESAAEAMGELAALPPRNRAQILRSVHDAVIRDRDELARLITAENGKPLREAYAEVDYAADFFLWFSAEPTRIGGELRIAPGGDKRILTVRRPVGVALLITPWNFPLAMAARKIAAALAAGCASVLKPSPETPLSAIALVDRVKETQAPQGSVELVVPEPPDSAVAAMLSHPQLKKLSFTGSTRVGRHLMEQVAGRLVSVSLELGGNAPFIVCADADVGLAVEAATVAKLRNSGASCVAANRMLVHRSVEAEFTSRLADRFHRLVVGDPMDDRTEVGPLINDAECTKVAAMVAGSLAFGSELVYGGKRPSQLPYFTPTVLRTSSQDPLLSSEIFGPVAPVVAFDDEEEAIDLANAVDAGLAAYVVSRDVRRALALAERLDVGMVGINRGLVSDPAAPFGGMKASGVGREGGREGIDAYLELQYIALDP